MGTVHQTSVEISRRVHRMQMCERFTDIYLIQDEEIIVVVLILTLDGKVLALNRLDCGEEGYVLG